MNYVQATELIKKVTGLNVPVYFNDMEANAGGSPYFGVGEHAWDIMDEDMIDHPMFELADFIENQHLKYYHVGLPNKIMKPGDEYIFKVIQKQLFDNGMQIELNEVLVEIFIILHEFGHAHELFVSYQGDVEHYLRETTEANRHASYQIKTYGLGGTEEGLMLHKSTATEKYADAFAIQYFESVIKEAKEQGLL